MYAEIWGSNDVDILMHLDVFNMRVFQGCAIRPLRATALLLLATSSSLL